MNRRITMFMAIAMMSMFANAQQFEEPEFIGEALLIENDSTVTVLEKNLVAITVKADATMYIFGMGTVKEKIEVNGAMSPVRAKAGNIKIIVRAVDNQNDPMSIISLFKFEVKKDLRKILLASLGTFSGSKSGNMASVSYSAKRYGESSYILTIPSAGAGEYGIIVKNPYTKDQKSTVVSSFGVD